MTMSAAMLRPCVRAATSGVSSAVSRRSLWSTMRPCQASLAPPSLQPTAAPTSAPPPPMPIALDNDTSSAPVDISPTLRTKTGVPHVYHRIRQLLINTPDITAGIQSTPDHIESLQRAQHAVRSGMSRRRRDNNSVSSNGEMERSQQPSFVNDEFSVDPVNHPNEAFFRRLADDGGDKIIHIKQSYLHVEYTRFLEPCTSIKGLTLDQAILQLAWSQKPIARRTEEALMEAIVVAKEKGLDLKKTYIAEAYARKNSAIISKRLETKYLRGRGRYGSIPHIKTSLLHIVLQERDEPFMVRVIDPLEWIRVRLRKHFEGVVPDAEAMYAQRMKARPSKPVYA